MNEWNNNEERFNSYDGCNSSGLHYNEKGPKRNSNRNNTQNRNKPRQDNRKDSQYLAKIVQQNETIIGLLKGIKQALNGGNSQGGHGKSQGNHGKSRPQKEKQKGSTSPQKKQYIQRFDNDKKPKDGISEKKRKKNHTKPLSDNSNVEVIEEQVAKVATTLDLDFTSENEVGEENPFTMFESK